MPREQTEQVTPEPGGRYITLRLDVLSTLFKDLGELTHQRRFGLSVREVRLLLQIYHNPGLTISQLMGLTYLDKTMTSRAVTRLSQIGLVKRLVGEQDARQVHLVLTPRGEKIARQASEAVIARTNDAMSVLSAREQEIFDRALDLLTSKVRSVLAEERSTPPSRKAATPKE